MDNLVGRLIGGANEETISLDVHVVPTPIRTPASHMIPSEECALHEIERSKAHWSQLRGVEDGDGDGDGDDDEDMDDEGVIQENRRVFSELKNHSEWMIFTKGPISESDLHSSVLGRKVAEGGQAEIFEYVQIDGVIQDRILLKVFKEGSRLSQLRRKWPSGVLQKRVPLIVLQGLLLTDGRFAFCMTKCWGDLRQLIDQAMQAKNNQGPPFPFEWNGVTMQALHIMEGIALQMSILHKEGIVHRDMKASNILLWKDMIYPHVLVADYECSIGVVGTKFWRAPEILLGMKNKTSIDYSEKVDVYSYAMTCFEIVTGLLPFEGEPEVSVDQVIEGQRPKLPSDLDVAMKGLIERCWDPNPLARPPFVDIFSTLHSMIIGDDEFFLNVDNWSTLHSMIISDNERL